MKFAFVLNVILAVCGICSAQTDPQHVPQPPAAQLQKFEPFLGKYAVSGDFANLPWTGTLEWKKVIKDWYIEQIIKIKSPGIDREFWVLSTWDKTAEKYRLWGFSTLPTWVEGGDVRFENGEMITEWASVAPDGANVFSSNHYHFLAGDELEIVSYRKVGDGPTQTIGTLRGKRLVNGEEGTAAVSVGCAQADEVLAALAERDKAFVIGDEAKVAQFMSEDYLQTDVSGNVQDKQTWLNEYYRPMAPLLKSGKTRWVRFDRSDIVLRDFGDTVVVAGKQTIKHVGVYPWNPKEITPADSPRPPVTLRFTHVWIKRAGAWKLAAVHNAIPTESHNPIHPGGK